MAPRDSIMSRARRFLVTGHEQARPDRRPPLPSRDRSIVGVGAHGAFAGLDDAVGALVPSGGPYRLNLLAKLYEHDRRFHVVRHGNWDLAFYAPEGTGFAPHCDVEGHLDRCFDVVAGLSDYAVMAEWGTSPELRAPMDLLREDGVPSEDMPTLALTCAQWTRYQSAPFDASRRGNEGPASHSFGGAVTMFAVRETPEEAVAVLRTEVGRFSRERMPLRPVDATPREVLVAGMGYGFVANLSGDLARAVDDVPLLRSA